MLLAEDLLLLLTDDDTGKLTASGDEVDLALGGALLIELALAERVDVAGPDEAVRQGRLLVRDPTPTGDGLLDEALAVVGQKVGSTPESVVAALGSRVRGRLYERLTDAGVLRAEEGRVLGIFPRHRWPSADTAHETSVRAELEQELRNGASTDSRTGALISLLHALRAAHRAVDPASVGLSKHELDERAKRIADGNWAARSVRRAIDDMYAVIAAATSTTITGGGS